jgi:hypothetical protein
MQHSNPASMAEPIEAKKRGKGGRPRGNPVDIRATTIGVRVAPAEYEALKTKAMQMDMTPAQFLRDAALKRRLPSPPVPEANRAEYAYLSRLSANLNQLVRLANSDQPVVVANGLLERLADEARRLRLALIGAGGRE